MATDSTLTVSTDSSGVITQLRRFVCGLHGHDSLLHFGEGRVSLLCSSCGHETPGWDVKGTPARNQTVRSGAARPERRVMRMPFVGERRVA
jgi:hypothetical protein